jgi:hypothetical protein
VWLLKDFVAQIWNRYRRLDWRLQVAIVVVVILFFTVNVPAR